MMGAPTSAMALFPAPRQRPRRRRGLLLAAVSGLSLAGCDGRLAFPNLLYLAIGTNTDQAIDAELVEETQGHLNTLERGYRQIHPASRFQFGLYPEALISAAISRRNRAGLGPDLIFVNGDTALRMLASGVVDPFPASSLQLNQFDPNDLDRLRNSRGELAGLPVLLHTQVACFNRKRLPNPPATVTELLAASAAGHPVGLTVEPQGLFWSAGSLGAVHGIEQAVAGQQPSATNKQRIEAWLAWLQNASNQQRITFFSDQPSALGEFMAGRLDWVPCNSISLPRLRKVLGPTLGVSTLPSGADGSPPSPIKRIRVLALGSSSSAPGRARAISYTKFTVNPLMQRALTVGSQSLLPANRFVKVPVQSSTVLAALDQSNQQSDQFSSLLTLMHDNDPRLNKAQALITELVFGEVNPKSSAQALIQLLGEKP
jgi:arabinogalactan oligomer/maltooligosaccharide transport system substrate-binding protein